ncbi:zinc metalloprotease [Bacteroidia bacterium]|nr:zinc metalloprotease [Bacteroidia bacterium]
MIMLLQLILGFSILIFLHELGHFLAAKAFGIRVDKFFLFFDAFKFKLFSFKIGETEFGMGWLPFGGYCKISGMVDESFDKEQLKSEPQSYEYRSKPAWQRLIVIIAGVVMNLVTGILIFSLLLTKQSYLPTEELHDTGIYASPLAREIGFQDGDVILKVDDKNVKRFNDVIDINNLLGGAEVSVLRGNDTLLIAIPIDAYKQLQYQQTHIFEPMNLAFSIDSVTEGGLAKQYGLQKGDVFLKINGDTVNSFGKFKELLYDNRNTDITVQYARNAEIHDTVIPVGEDAVLGFMANIDQNYQVKQYSVGESFYYGTKDAFSSIFANAKGLGKIFSGKEKVSESLQGPIGIAQVYGSQWNWYRFWYITGLLSLILAFMNILPIPALDGGHLIFILYELITRRKPSQRVMEVAQIIGIVFLLMVMLFACGNDIARLF